VLIYMPLWLSGGPLLYFLLVVCVLYCCIRVRYKRVLLYQDISTKCRYSAQLHQLIHFLVSLSNNFSIDYRSCCVKRGINIENLRTIQDPDKRRCFTFNEN
jgi:hypothetical protein